MHLHFLSYLPFSLSSLLLHLLPITFLRYRTFFHSTSGPPKKVWPLTKLPVVLKSSVTTSWKPRKSTPSCNSWASCGTLSLGSWKPLLLLLLPSPTVSVNLLITLISSVSSSCSWLTLSLVSWKNVKLVTLSRPWWKLLLLNVRSVVMVNGRLWKPLNWCLVISLPVNWVMLSLLMVVLLL